MREVRIAGNVPSAPDDVFAAVSNIERFPDLAPDVREVNVSEVDGRRQSAWKVKFRGGMLEWTEQDELDPATRTLTFRQLHGDFMEFFGEWRVEPRDSGSAVLFNASFDLGIPALRAVLDADPRGRITGVDGVAAARGLRRTGVSVYAPNGLGKSHPAPSGG